MRPTHGPAREKRQADASLQQIRAAAAAAGGPTRLPVQDPKGRSRQGTRSGQGMEIWAHRAVKRGSSPGPPRRRPRGSSRKAASHKVGRGQKLGQWTWGQLQTTGNLLSCRHEGGADFRRVDDNSPGWNRIRRKQDQPSVQRPLAWPLRGQDQRMMTLTCAKRLELELAKNPESRTPRQISRPTRRALPSHRGRRCPFPR